MLIPLRHENMEGRRWPIVTFVLIGLNILIFLATHWTIEAQEPERLEVRTQILILAASHPDLTMPDDVEQFVNEVKKEAPEAAWEKLAKRGNTPTASRYDEDGELLQSDDRQELQSRMDGLAQRFQEVEKSSILENYGFVPAHPKPISYLTSMFLHLGWLHLIGNMWFLWLAGFILEDRWGRLIYPIFYLLAGFVASIFHAMFYPHSIATAVGASGAVAALMGGFLVRFPKLKIQMLWYLFIFRIKFKAPAYALLPLWLLMEILSGTLFGQMSGVAHWAHVGGFIFGALAGLVISRTSLEHEANAVIESKIGWTADPAIMQATECMEKGRFDEGIAAIKKYLATKPDAIDAQAILSQLYWRKNDIPAHLEATIKLCQLHLKAQDSEAALTDFQEYRNAGGEKMPAGTWLEICRLIEGQQHYDRAVTEYEKLAKTYPREKQSLLALLSAGRLTLKQLNRPSDALLYYKAAKASKIPHVEWESNIAAGIQAAEKATGVSYAPTAKS